MKLNQIITLLVAFITFSCSTTSELPSHLKGNWLNANDSTEWIISLQPEFAVFRNEFQEYENIKGTRNKVKIILANKETKITLLINSLDSNTLVVKDAEGKKWKLTRSKSSKPDFKNYETQGFGDIELTDDTAVIKGFIENYDPKLYDETGYVLIYHGIHGRNEEFAKTDFIIDSSGKFSVSFRIFNPQFIFLNIEGSTFTHIMTCPGDTCIIGFNRNLTAVTCDQNKWESLSDWDINHYMGKNAKLSEELIYFQTLYNERFKTNYLDKMENMDVMPQLDYIIWRKDIANQEKNFIDSILSCHNSSKKAEQFMHSEIDIDLISELYSYKITGMRFQELGPLYVSQIPEIRELTAANLANYNYVSLLNNLINSKVYNPMSESFNIKKRYILNSAIPLVEKPEEKQLIQKMLVDAHPDPEYFNTKLDFSADKSAYDKFINQQVKSLNDDFDKFLESHKDLIHDSVYFKAFLLEMQSFTDGNNSLLFELLTANRLNNYLKNPHWGAVPEDWVTQTFQHPLIRKIILERVKNTNKEETQYVSHAEKTYFIDHLVSEGSPETFFDEIIGQFRGKVIYIDFWADWCSPCRAGIKAAKKLKQNYEDRDVVFLYFGMNCKKENWDKAIKKDQINGYHYWLNREQSEIMAERFGIIGIPHYLLVNKDGDILNENVPGPDDKSKIYTTLDELLAK